MRNTKRTGFVQVAPLGIWFAMSGFTACGGAERPPDARIAEKMAGLWEGATFISRPGLEDVTFSQAISISLDTPTHAVFRGLCAGGPDITIAGEGTRLVASTVFTCSPAPVPGCESASLVFTALEISLFSGNSLNIVGDGTIVGCDNTTPMRFVFDASRGP